MKLSDFLSNGLEKFSRGQCDSISILDAEGETLQVVAMDKFDTIKPEYLSADFAAVGSSTLKPTRLRIRINYMN